ADVATTALAVLSRRTPNLRTRTVRNQTTADRYLLNSGPRSRTRSSRYLISVASTSSWDRWGDNLENTKNEMWEAYTAWSKREEDPEYSNFTIGANAVMMTAGLQHRVFRLFGLVVA